MKISILLIVGLLISGSAMAEEIFLCVDQEIVGFKFTDNIGKRTTFKKGKFLLKVISKYKRQLKFPQSLGFVDFNCHENNPRSPVAACFIRPALGIATGSHPIVFLNNRYERGTFFSEALFTKELNGGTELYVAYGTCTKL
jgi:hypothetical protein